MKAMIEKKNSLIEEMEGLLNAAKAETRAFTDEENSRVEEIKKEIRGLEKLIADEEEIRTFDKSEVTQVQGGKEMTTEEIRDFNAEIRKAIKEEKELDIANFEVEERTKGMGMGSGGAITQQVGNIAKKTFANEILKKAADTSELYNYVRKENLGSANHQMAVQKDKIGTFANVKELADYAQKNISFDTINLAAHKYGNISIVSEEAIADLGYNIMAELIEQYGEAAGNKLDELLVKGDTGNGVQGLNSFVQNNSTNPEGSTKVVTLTQNQQNKVSDLLAKLVELYNAVPRKYAKNGTWVVSSELAAMLNTATDANGRPLLYQDFTQVPFGGKVTPMLLGRPVVITDEVTSLTGAAANSPIAFFGDLNRALVCGIRQNFTIKTSTEYGFINDGVAIKGTMRLDVKRALTEAMGALVRSN